MGVRCRFLRPCIVRVFVAQEGHETKGGIGILWVRILAVDEGRWLDLVEEMMDRTLYIEVFGNVNDLQKRSEGGITPHLPQHIN